MDHTLRLMLLQSAYPDHEPVSTLFRAADMALYTAKHRGRDQTVVCGDRYTVAKTTIGASFAS